MADILIQAGSPLYLGNINDELIDNILIRAEKNVFLHILEKKGPVELKRILESAGENVCVEEFYHVQCELCCDLLGNPEILSMLERQVYQ